MAARDGGTSKRPDLAVPGQFATTSSARRSTAIMTSHVVRVVEVVHADVGVDGGIGAGQDDLALAVGLHRVGEDDHGLGVGRQPLGRVVEVLVGIDA